MLDTKLLDEKSEATLERIMGHARVPAVAYACVIPEPGSKGTFTRDACALGKKDAGSDAPVSGNTRFPASSLSKVVFTYLVLKLVGDGKLSLKDKLLPEAPNERLLVGGKYPDKAKQLTVEHVLSHTTSLPNVGLDWRPDIKMPLKFDEAKLGEKYSYSGEAFFYLQQFVEAKMSKILGKKVTLQELSQEYVFGETALNMKRSTFLPHPVGDDVVKVHSELHDATAINEFAPQLDVANAAGSLLTTANDLSIFMEAWLKEMNNETFQQAFKSRVKTGFKECGLGWHIYRYEEEGKEHVIAYQFGANTDTRAFMALDLTANKAAAFMTNSANGMSIANQVFTSPDLAPIGDLRAIFRNLDYPQCDEPGWPETLDGIIAEDQGWIANEKGDIKDAQRCFKQARRCFDNACKSAPGEKKYENRLQWFEQVQNATSEWSVPKSVLGTYTNQYGDRIKIAMQEGSLALKEGPLKTTLTQISETEFIPSKDQACKLIMKDGQMTMVYLSGAEKELKLTKPAPSSFGVITISLDEQASPRVRSKSGATPTASSSEEERFAATKLTEKEQQIQHGSTSEDEGVEHEEASPDSSASTFRFK